MRIKARLHDRELIQKLWQMFRIGQTTYIAYAIGLVNFTLILYKLGGVDKYIEPLPFAFVLIAIMLPLGIVIGVIHVKKQIPIETKIMAHHNPYVYKAVLNSKETMGIKTAIWNFDNLKVSNNFMEFQADMNKKLWTAMNELTGKKIFTKDDMNKMDSIQKNIRIIEQGVDDWKGKYQQLFDGKNVSEIPGVYETYELEKDNPEKDKE